MNNAKYVFNPQTLQYEELKLSPKQKTLRLLGFLSAVMMTAILLFGLAWIYMPFSPKEKAMERELGQMKTQYGILSSDYDDMANQLNQLHEKDSEVHRLIFEMDNIDDNIWEGGIGGHDKFALIPNYGENSSLVKETLQKVDKIKRKLSIQRTSLDTIHSMAYLWEEKLASLPSIKPIQETKLKRNIRYLSGYGYRIHPIHKIKKFHYGIDFTAPRGTAIQATANGKIKKVSRLKSGYGNSILIDHGYGYETLYAHMQDIEVKKGQKITKGQRIGTVGSSGTSTAPHLHYEVRLNGEPLNPIDFCLDNLTPEEYRILMNNASLENQSLD